jgi:hypothetical protein
MSQKVHIVPIGSNCQPAFELQRKSKRVVAFPFDWAVLYRDVTRIFQNDLKDLYVFHEKDYNHDYQIKFHHHQDGSENSKGKIERRSRRLLDILEKSEDKVIFIRWGHTDDHHKEYTKKQYDGGYSELNDMKKLEELFKKKYPNLNFCIYLFLVCEKCRHCENVQENSETLKVIDLITPDSMGLQLIREARFSIILDKLLST